MCPSIVFSRLSNCCLSTMALSLIPTQGGRDHYSRRWRVRQAGLLVHGAMMAHMDARHGARRILPEETQQDVVEQLGLVEERKVAALRHHDHLGGGDIGAPTGPVGLDDLNAPAV